jgi:hypothetical protein
MTSADDRRILRSALSLQLKNSFCRDFFAYFRRSVSVSPLVSTFRVCFYEVDSEVSFLLWVARTQRAAFRQSTAIAMLTWCLFFVHDLYVYETVVGILYYYIGTVASAALLLGFAKFKPAVVDGMRIFRFCSFTAFQFGVFIVLVNFIRGLVLNNFAVFSPALCLWFVVVFTSLRLHFRQAMVITTLLLLMCLTSYLILYDQSKISQIDLICDLSAYISLYLSGAWTLFSEEHFLRRFFGNIALPQHGRFQRLVQNTKQHLQYNQAKIACVLTNRVSVLSSWVALSF